LLPSGIFYNKAQNKGKKDQEYGKIIFSSYFEEYDDRH